jgi:glycosyltransferase involved in cell wall biosynthesis
MLGLAESLPPEFGTAFVSFRESGLCQAFLDEVRGAGFEGVSLRHDTPHLVAALKELIGELRRLGTDILCCHGYKANLLGLLAARRIGIPVIAISRGWTAESLRIRVYEILDRRLMRWMDKVVCVSAAQAKKVRSAGVRTERIKVIHNAIRPERFANPDPASRDLLHRMFPEPPALVVGAAGRLSPEKGFAVLIDAASQVLNSSLPGLGNEMGGEAVRIGFILFGDGALREALTRQIAACGLTNRFILGGFHPDLERYLPYLDLFVQSSFTEGLPNVILEAQAAGVPVVATSVGGTPELIEDGKTGWLVPSGDAAALADRIALVLSDRSDRFRVSQRAQIEVRERFAFTRQAREYGYLFAAHLCRESRVCQPTLKGFEQE